MGMLVKKMKVRMTAMAIQVWNPQCGGGGKEVGNPLTLQFHTVLHEVVQMEKCTSYHHCQANVQIISRSGLENILDCKAITGEDCLAQHRTLLLNFCTPVEHQSSNQRKNEVVKSKGHKSLQELKKSLPPSGNTLEVFLRRIQQQAISRLPNSQGKQKRAESELLNRTGVVVTYRSRKIKMSSSVRRKAEMPVTMQNTQQRGARPKNARRQYTNDLYEKLSMDNDEQNIYRLKLARAAAKEEYQSL